MKELLDKLSSYNLFNYLLPGVLFAVIGDWLTSYTLILEDIVIGVFVYYFFGLVISRVGSIIVELFLKHIKVLQFAPYTDFVRASKIDEKLELLSESNNMYRTLLSTLVCLLLLQLFEYLEQTYSVISEYYATIIILLLILLFVLSYRKQTSYISVRVRRAITLEKTDLTTEKEKSK